MVLLQFQHIFDVRDMKFWNYTRCNKLFLMMKCIWRMIQLDDSRIVFNNTRNMYIYTNLYINATRIIYINQIVSYVSTWFEFDQFILTEREQILLST